MEPDRLDTLLQQADQAAGLPPTSPADLADRVRQLARRRHRTQLVIRGTVAAAMAIGLGLTVYSAALRQNPAHQPLVLQSPSATPASDDEVAELRSEIAQLRQEASRLAAQIQGMAAIQEQRQRLDRLEQAMARLGSGEEIRGQMERAAFTIVYQADRLDRELGLRESAVQAYREAIRLFPETPSAEVARARLAEINRQGDQL